MSTFDEAQHPRARAGRFATKANRQPAAALDDGGNPKPGERRGASLARGEFGDFELSKHRKTRGSEGQGFTATLHYRGHVAGHVIQSGDGGATYAHFTDQAARDAFRGLISEEWGFDTSSGAPHAEEHVLDALALDHEVTRKLHRDRKMQTLPIMLADDVAASEENDGVTQYRVVTHGVGDEAEIARDLRRRGKIDGALYFDGHNWVPFTTVRP